MASNETQSVSLGEAAVGSVFRVLRVDADCDDAARLKAMGVCTGRRLSLVQSGDPMIVCVVGSRVGISARLAKAVYVQSDGLSSQKSPAA